MTAEDAIREMRAISDVEVWKRPKYALDMWAEVIGAELNELHKWCRCGECGKKSEEQMLLLRYREEIDKLESELKAKTKRIEELEVEIESMGNRSGLA